MSEIVDRLQSEMKTLADMINILGRENERLRSFCRPEDILGCSDEVARLAYESYSKCRDEVVDEWHYLNRRHRDAWHNVASHVAIHTLAVVDAVQKESNGKS